MTLLSNFVQQIWLVLGELAPWFIVGALVAGLMHGLAPSGFVRKRFSGATGVLWSVLLGIPLPLCSCAVIPTGIGLRRNGASEASSVAFLIATPQTGIDSVFVTAAFLGWTFAIYKLFVALILGVAAGWTIHWFGKNQKTMVSADEPISDCCSTKPQETSCCNSTASTGNSENPNAKENAVVASGATSATAALPAVQLVSLGRTQPNQAISHQTESTKTTATKPQSDSVTLRLQAAKTTQTSSWISTIVKYLIQSINSSLAIVRSIYVWVLIGVVLSAALTTLMPPAWISQFAGQGYAVQLLVALLLGIPLYVCATASVPIASALVQRGLSVGAATVFLIAGPATNVATIGAVKSQFSRFAFWTYMAFAAIGSIVFAVAFDLIFPDAFVTKSDHSHQHNHWLNHISGALLLLLFAYFWLSGIVKKTSAGSAENSERQASCCSH